MGAAITLSIVETNKDLKQHHVFFIPDYLWHLVTWHLAVSHTLHILCKNFCFSVVEIVLTREPVGFLKLGYIFFKLNIRNSWFGKCVNVITHLSLTWTTLQSILIIMKQEYILYNCDLWLSVWHNNICSI
jgi:hypothetical protein